MTVEHSLATKAAALAGLLHANQKYGDKPYVSHLADVTNVLAEFGFGDDDEIMAAGWLHDSIEDASITGEVLWLIMTPAVADLVAGVTDEPGADRKERKAATYPKIRKNPRCVALKLADRIANVRTSKTNPEKLAMYREEYAEFRAALWREGEFVEMWAELDGRLGGAE